MSKLTKITIAGICTLLLLVGLARFSLWYGYYLERQDALTLVQKIDAFERRNGQLPATLQDMGIAETEAGRGPFYKPSSNHHYVVWFAEELGECYTFDSETRHWSFSCSP